MAQWLSGEYDASSWAYNISKIEESDNYKISSSESEYTIINLSLDNVSCSCYAQGSLN